ncbi:MAG: serine/threonine-protein phosphatase [Bacteroidales bacterium]|nr:serine/threonine-protein phosphatase [Bacteroidales bacterium]
MKNNNIYHKINSFLIGNLSEFSLKHRLFTMSCFWVFLLGSFFTIFSLSENHILQIILSFVGSVSFLLMYYFSRIKHLYNTWLFMIAMAFFLSISWFFNDGSNGPTVYLFILSVLSLFSIFERKYYSIIIITIILNIIILWFIEIQFPELIKTNLNDRIVHTFLYISITTVFAGIIIDQLAFNFNEEQQKTIREKAKIEYLHKKILSSINYANNIQEALLPDSEKLKTFFPDHFILFKPKEIVSGDFYWVKKLEGKTVFAVADCTGHGVPGAFLSMLGISFLNEITANNNLLQTDQILNSLRQKVKDILRQNSDAEVIDGMDIAICIIDFQERKLQYAGANNPMYIIRNNNMEKPELIELNPDFMPIGVYLKEEPFNSITIQLKKNDMLYLFSDGYKDQEGGKYRRKFLANRFKELLIEIHDKELNTQKELLIETFENWKKEANNQQLNSFNELETILSNINKELITSKIKEADLIIRKIKNHINIDRSFSLSNITEVLSELKLNQKTKQKIINYTNIQTDDVIVVGIKI